MNRRQKINNRPLPPRKLPTQCLCCGAADPWAITKVDISAPFRSTTHEIRMEMHQCRHCDAVTTTPEQSAAISAKVREAHCQWLATKLKKIQKQLGGMSLRDIEDKTKISFATLGRISASSPLVEESMEIFVFHELDKLVQSRKEVQFLTMGDARLMRVMQGSFLIHYKVIHNKRFDAILASALQSTISSYEDSAKRGNPPNVNDYDLQLA
jgi:hypothetical protein